MHTHWILICGQTGGGRGGSCGIDGGSIALGSRRRFKEEKEGSSIKLNSNDLPHVKLGPSLVVWLRKMAPGN